MSIFRFTCAYFGLYVFAAAMIGAALGAAISPWMTWMSTDIERKRQEIVWAPWQVVTAAMAAGAAILAAGAALGALLVRSFGH